MWWEGEGLVVKDISWINCSYVNINIIHKTLGVRLEINNQRQGDVNSLILSYEFKLMLPTWILLCSCNITLQIIVLFTAQKFANN